MAMRTVVQSLAAAAPAPSVSTAAAAAIVIDGLQPVELPRSLQRETLISVSRIAHSWAGLRSFVADGAPVVGYDAVVPDFFWLAGQGGYGIMMAPTLGRAVASLIGSGSLPAAPS